MTINPDHHSPNPNPNPNPNSKEPVDRSFIDGGGRRLACKKAEWMENWWVAYSPRNGDSAVAEGSWSDWLELAENILEIDRKLKAGHPEI